MRTARCRFMLLWLALSGPFLALAQLDCLDSLRLVIQPVQCFGLRDGHLEIEKVFGGYPPFAFSLDGTSFSNRGEFDRLPAGEYTLYVRDVLGCISTQTFLVPEPEELRVKLSVLDSLVIVGTPFTIRAEVLPPDRLLSKISWRPPSLFTVQDTLTQTLFLSESTVFALEVYDQNDCPARDQLTVHVEKINLYFPNAFEPGSNQNSWFTVFAGEGVQRVVALKVYSRVGSLVFERANFAPNDPLMGWNGKWRGRPVQQGVYLWVAVIEYLDGRQTPFRGTVTVLRDGD